MKLANAHDPQAFKSRSHSSKAQIQISNRFTIIKRSRLPVLSAKAPVMQKSLLAAKRQLKHGLHKGVAKSAVNGRTASTMPETGK
jgi:hypothetical protein